MRKTTISTVGLRFLLPVALWILLTAPALAQMLSIPGTGACEPILAELAAAYNRGNTGNPVRVLEKGWRYGHSPMPRQLDVMRTSFF
ncbi:MAG: hypothetical protein Q8K00_19355 [Syntrophales bacterium]|nr:hypothetical protein [Syntrophales bacterium]